MNNVIQGMERFQSFISTRLQGDANPKDVYYELLAAGLPKKDAGKLLSATIATLIEQGLFDPTYFDEVETYIPKEERSDIVQEDNMTEKNTQAEEEEYTASYDEENDAVANQFFGSDVDKGETQAMVGQMKKGGMLDLSDLPPEVAQQYEDKTPISFDKVEQYYNPVSNIEFPSLSEYMPNYNPVSWEEISMAQSEVPQKGDGGASKKKFVKNVMNLVRAKEGMESENQKIASGERQDTLLNEVAAVSDKFKSALKSSADEALSKSVYDNALKLGDPKLIDMVQNIGDEQEQMSEQGMMRDGGLPKHNYTGIVKGGKQASNALSKFFGFGSKTPSVLSIPGNRYASIFNDAMGGGLNLKTDFKTFSPDEMAKLSQINKIINMSQDVSLANNRSIRKILENEKRFKNVSDDDLRILLGAGRDGLRKRIDSGFDVFGNQRNEIIQKQDWAAKPGNIADWKVGFGEVTKNNLFNDMSESDAIKLFESDPYLLQKYRMLYGRPGKTDVHPLMNMLFKDDFSSAREMTNMLKTGVNSAYKESPVGSIITGSEDLSADSYPMTYGMMRRFANNAENLGLYKDPLLYGYGPVSSHGYLDKFYFDKKKVQEFDDIGDIKSPMPGLSLLETHQKMRKDLNQKYKNISSDYVFNQINQIDQRYGDSWLEKFGALTNPADGKTYFPLVGMGKTQNKGKLLEEGGTVDNELYKFISGGDDPMYARDGVTVGSYMDADPGGPFDPTVYNPAVSNLITPIDSPEVLVADEEVEDIEDPIKRIVRKSTINYVPGQTIHVTPWQARRMMKGKNPFKRRGVLGQLGDMLIPGNIGPRYNFGTMRYPQIMTTSKDKGRLSKFKDKTLNMMNNFIEGSDMIDLSMLKSDRQELRDKIKNINDSDYGVRAKMALRQGERQAFRNERRAERNPEGRVVNRTTRDRSGGAGSRLADRLFPNRDLNMGTRLKIAGSKIANSGLSKFIPGMAEGGLPMATNGYEMSMGVNKPFDMREKINFDNVNLGPVELPKMPGTQTASDPIVNPITQKSSPIVMNAEGEYEMTEEEKEEKKKVEDFKKNMVKAEEFTKTTDPTAGLVMGMGLAGAGADVFSNAQGIGAANRANANNEMYTAEGNAANAQQGVFQGREKTNDGLIGSKYTGSNTSSFNPVTTQYGGFMEEGGVSEDYEYISLDGLSDDEIQAYLDMGGVIEYQ